MSEEREEMKKIPLKDQICKKDRGVIEYVNKIRGDHKFVCAACCGMICEPEIMTKEEYEKWQKKK